MNASSDASTSTDDVKGRPLCLFYFTHPFGVLSPEAPRVFDMESAPPFCWPSASDSYRSSSPTPPVPPPADSTATRRRAPPLLDSFSSSLLSSETWLTASAACSSGSCGAGGGGRRYARILPPLRVPSPRDLVDYSSDDVWPRRRRRPPAARFSLPPIELPPLPAALHPAVPLHPALPPPPPEPRARRSHPFPSGVDKHRRRHRRVRAGDLRRLLARLIRRTITGGGAMVQEVVEAVPVVHACCGCVPLRAGVAVAAVTGLAAAAGYLWLHCAGGGVAGGAAWRAAHGAAGVLLAALHALLLAAAVRGAAAAPLLELYAWAMLPLSAGLLLVGAALALTAALAHHLLFAALALLLVFLTVSLGVYYIVVTVNYRMTLP